MVANYIQSQNKIFSLRYFRLMSQAVLLVKKHLNELQQGLCFYYFNRKQCITSESQFDFLKELVNNIPDLPTNEEEADDLDEPKPKRYDIIVGNEDRGNTS